MGWADHLERLTAVVRDTFPSAVVYDPDGSAQSLTGVFDESYKAVELEHGVAVDSTYPRLTLRTEDLGSTEPGSGDHLTVDARRWEVTAVEPDGSGMVVLRLVEVVS